jgi:hypothetical protein
MFISKVVFCAVISMHRFVLDLAFWATRLPLCYSVTNPQSRDRDFKNRYPTQILREIKYRWIRHPVKFKRELFSLERHVAVYAIRGRIGDVILTIFTSKIVIPPDVK